MRSSRRLVCPPPIRLMPVAVAAATALLGDGPSGGGRGPVPGGTACGGHIRQWAELTAGVGLRHLGAAAVRQDGDRVTLTDVSTAVASDSPSLRIFAIKIS